MSRFTTELTASKALVAELDIDETTAAANLTTERTTAQESSTAVFDLDGKVKNLTHQVDDVVRNAIAAVRLHFDLIQTPHTG